MAGGEAGAELAGGAEAEGADGDVQQPGDDVAVVDHHAAVDHGLGAACPHGELGDRRDDFAETGVLNRDAAEHGAGDARCIDNLPDVDANDASAEERADYSSASRMN